MSHPGSNAILAFVLSGLAFLSGCHDRDAASARMDAPDVANSLPARADAIVLRTLELSGGMLASSVACGLTGRDAVDTARASLAVDALRNGASAADFDLAFDVGFARAEKAFSAASPEQRDAACEKIRGLAQMDPAEQEAALRSQLHAASQRMQHADTQTPASTAMDTERSPLPAGGDQAPSHSP